MTSHVPPRSSRRAPAVTEALSDQLSRAIRAEIQIALVDLDTADQTRVLLKVQAFIGDTLEALDTSTEN